MMNGATRSHINQASERQFFSGLAIALALVTFVGFAPTYYLVDWLEGTTTRGLSGSKSLTPWVHAHGVTGSIWMILLVVQTRLIAANRHDLHRNLGLLAIPVGLAIAVTAVMVSLNSARNGTTPRGWDAGGFLLFQSVTLGGFLLFSILALAWRKRPDYHKRLIMLATISMMVPVCGRVWKMLALTEYARNSVGGMILSDLFLLAMVVFDLRVRKRLHPVTLIGGGLLLLGQPLRLILAQSETGIAIGRALLG
jgi:hypothetical protein